MREEIKTLVFNRDLTKKTIDMILKEQLADMYELISHSHTSVKINFSIKSSHVFIFKSTSKE